MDRVEAQVARESLGGQVEQTCPHSEALVAQRDNQMWVPEDGLGKLREAMRLSLEPGNGGET